MKTTDALLQSLRDLPDGAHVTVSVARDDLIHALEKRSDNPDRVVTTAWCSEVLGRSQEWWAEECRSGRIREAWQESEGSPWYLRAGVARTHLSRHIASLDRRRSRRRGPRQTRGQT